MRKAVDKEDWDAMEKGRRPKRKVRAEMPNPKFPEVEKQIRFDSIPLGDLIGFTHTKKVVTNEEGIKFIGFDVTLTLKDKKNPVSGWMSEADVIKLLQHRRS